MAGIPKPTPPAIRVFASHAEATAAEHQPWPPLTPQESLALVWPLTLEQFRLAGLIQNEPRLCRTAVRFTRR